MSIVDDEVWEHLSLHERVEALYADLLLCSKSNGRGDQELYETMRSELLRFEEAPTFLRTVNTLDKFWRYVQAMGGYHEREMFLASAFESLRSTELESQRSQQSRAGGIPRLQSASVTPAQEDTRMEVPSMKRVFVSHSSSDKAIVRDAVKLLLEDGSGVPSARIFFSSSAHAEQRPPVGTYFLDSIRLAIQNTQYALVWVTPKFLASHMCVAELGALWAYLDGGMACVFEGHDRSTVNGVLKGIQSFSLSGDHATVKEELDHLHLHVQGTLSLPARLTRWQVARDEFVGKHF